MSGAVIVANVRSGGTFLCHCLSNHPDMFCDRGEPLHARSAWRAAIRDPRRLLDCVLDQFHYRVSVCKLTYPQAWRPAVWAYLQERDLPVIWLRRENLLRQAVSLQVLRAARRGTITDRSAHTTEALPPAGIRLDGEALVAEMRGLEQTDAEAQARLSAFSRVLPLTYADVVGGEGVQASRLPAATARRICRLLGVPYRAMPGGLVRMNPQPLADVVANWPDVEGHVRRSSYARFLEAA